MGTAAFSMDLKYLGHEADYPISASIESENGGMYTTTSPYDLIAFTVTLYHLHYVAVYRL
jgi:hypothetical protein